MNGIVTEEDAFDFLRENHPEFFEDPVIRGLASVVILEMGEDLENLSPVQRAASIACIISLMYRMGTAAIISIRDPRKRHMGKIFIERAAAERAQGRKYEGEHTTAQPTKALGDSAAHDPIESPPRLQGSPSRFPEPRTPPARKVRARRSGAQRTDAHVQRNAPQGPAS